MQIKPFTREREIHPYVVSGKSEFLDCPDWLQADLEAESDSPGFRITRVGKDSPLRQLQLRDFVFSGRAESGDRIVAIDGVRVCNRSQIYGMTMRSDPYELSIFDFRTRQTVSWQMRFSA